MPGSPASNTADPATSPPPSTRSNSAISDGARGGGAAEPARSTNSSFRPDEGLALARPGPASTASSMIVFHSPQASQRPAHFGVTAPQAWQTKRATGLAMGNVLKQRTKEGLGAAQAHRGPSPWFLFYRTAEQSKRGDPDGPGHHAQNGGVAWKSSQASGRPLI